MYVVSRARCFRRIIALRRRVNSPGPVRYSHAQHFVWAFLVLRFRVARIPCFTLNRLKKSRGIYCYLLFTNHRAEHYRFSLAKDKRSFFFSAWAIYFEIYSPAEYREYYRYRLLDQNPHCLSNLKFIFHN